MGYEKNMVKKEKDRKDFGEKRPASPKKGIRRAEERRMLDDELDDLGLTPSQIRELYK